MYELENLERDGTFLGVRITHHGRLVAELKYGISLVVATQYAAIADPKEKAHFLNGIVLAMNHCTLTGSVPVAMVG